MTNPIPRDAIATRLAEVGYIADSELATALWMMDYLKRPLLIEGEAGVGKTEVAKALAAVHDSELIRMQCYEGLDASSSLYEWNYQRQLIAIKARELSGESAEAVEAHIFSEHFLLERPLLAAIRPDRRSAGARRPGPGRPATLRTSDTGRRPDRRGQSPSALDQKLGRPTRSLRSRQAESRADLSDGYPRGVDAHRPDFLSRGSSRRNAGRERRFLRPATSTKP